MKNIVLLLTIGMSLLWSCNTPVSKANQITNNHLDPVIEAKIDSLMASMSLDEKIGQTALRGTSSRVKGALPEALKEAVRAGKIGALLNVINPEHVDILQKIAVEESPNGIPLIFARDVIHGFKTIFPIPLGLAASWDTTHAINTGQISAFEASAVGLRWTFAPMLDISTDSRWGRIAESGGEDPYLSSLIAKSFVKGFQGPDPSDPTSLAACAKHFVGYGAAIGGRDYNTVIIHEPLLRNVYLPPFKAAVDAGALTLMSAFNEINGVPATGNHFILQEVLRDEWQFDGFVVSDWNSVTEMIPHSFAADEKEAAQKAALAGLDMEMMSQSYDHHLKELIQEGLIPESRLDFYVRNILRVKFKLGLFDKPYRNPAHTGDWYSEAHLNAAKEAAKDGSVLLKNTGLLPLKGNEKVAIIGPLADAPHEQLGTWTFDGEKERTITPLNVFSEREHSYQYAPGLAYSRDKSTNGFAEAVKIATQSDVILFFGGEEAILSGEAHSRANIRLPGAQEDLIKSLSATGKPIVLVIMAGRPIQLTDIIDDLDAVLMAWHPGTMGGAAIYELLYGIFAPSGRLPVSWPKTAGQCPIYYNHKPTGRPADSSRFVHIDDIEVGAWQSSLGNESHYLDAGFTPHFPFGYGLTYTTFSYSEPTLSATSIKASESLQISAQIKNTGARTGTETVQLYIRDVAASITRPVRELKRFQQITLEPGAEQEVTFEISIDDLKFYNQDGALVHEPGEFHVWIAGHAETGKQAAFTLN